MTKGRWYAGGLLLVLALVSIAYAQNQSSEGESNQTVNESILNESVNRSIPSDSNSSLNFSENSTTNESPINQGVENQTTPVNGTFNNTTNQSFENETSLNQTAPPSNETVNETINQTNPTNVTGFVGGIDFAQTINGESIDTPYIRTYFGWYKNFSDVPYINLSKRTFGENPVKTIFLKSVAEDTNKQGFVAGDKKYVVHVVACDKERQMCNIRLNGAIMQISSHLTNQIELQNNYILQVNSIDFDYCDGRRFCDYYYESYDRINMTVDLTDRLVP